MYGDDEIMINMVAGSRERMLNLWRTCNGEIVGVPSINQSCRHTYHYFTFTTVPCNLISFASYYSHKSSNVSTFLCTNLDLIVTFSLVDFLDEATFDGAISGTFLTVYSTFLPPFHLCISGSTARCPPQPQARL